MFPECVDDTLESLDGYVLGIPQRYQCEAEEAGVRVKLTRQQTRAVSKGPSQQAAGVARGAKRRHAESNIKRRAIPRKLDGEVRESRPPIVRA